MGKYIGYALLVAAIILALELFNIVDIPYLEIPDFFGTKNEMTQKTKDVLNANQ
jgi:hypothetical protein